MLGIEHKGDYTLLKTGLATFKNYYRGSPFIKMILIALIMVELIKHPLTPVYLIAKVYSYNPDTFVIENEDSCLAENLTVLSEQDLQNPHIKFFVERNPGWKKVYINTVRIVLHDHS